LVHVGIAQIIQKLAAFGNHFQQAALGMHILGVPFQVFLQAVNFFAQQSDLHRRGTGVFPMQFILFYQFGFFFNGKHFFIDYFLRKIKLILIYFKF